MNYSYWAKQEILPLAKIASVLAEYAVVIHDIRIENYQDQYDIFYNGYVATFSNYRTELVAIGSEDEADITKVMVNVEAFVEWAYKKQIPMPNEFLERIDKADQVIKLNTVEVDKLLIKAIAKTLWLLNPDWTQEKVAKHKAILQFGAGINYSHKSLKKWIAEYDPRSQSAKTGPRKKLAIT